MSLSIMATYTIFENLEKRLNLYNINGVGTRIQRSSLLLLRRGVWRRQFVVSAVCLPLQYGTAKRDCYILSETGFVLNLCSMAGVRGHLYFVLSLRD